MAEASARKQPPRCTPVLLSPHDGPSKLRFLRRTHATRVKICTPTTHRCDKQDAVQSRSSPGADMIGVAYQLRAALTASSTSSSPALAHTEITFSVAGLMTSKVAPCLSRSRITAWRAFRYGSGLHRTAVRRSRCTSWGSCRDFRRYTHKYDESGFFILKKIDSASGSWRHSTSHALFIHTRTSGVLPRTLCTSLTATGQRAARIHKQRVRIRSARRGTTDKRPMRCWIYVIRWTILKLLAFTACGYHGCRHHRRGAAYPNVPITEHVDDVQHLPSVGDAPPHFLPTVETSGQAIQHTYTPSLPKLVRNEQTCRGGGSHPCTSGHCSSASSKHRLGVPTDQGKPCG